MVDENSEELEEWLKENPPFSGPYVFAVDLDIVLKVADDKRKREEKLKSSGDTRTVENSTWLRGII